MKQSLQTEETDNLRLYTIAEAADRLRISVDYLYKLALRREIASVKIGKRRLFLAEHLSRFVESRTEESVTR